MKAFFISSTFKDMQSERDILHERVFPKLRKVIKEYGEEVQEVDLRWGVDTVNMTEEESGHEVLKICIDAIDRCKPYLIVLLGERYGWIPGRDIVDSANDLRISDRYEAEMSITELEIQYGALLNEEAFDKCVFCFRDPSVTDKIDPDERKKYEAESEHHAKRLTALKNQINSRGDAVIMHYTADWDSESKSICGLEGFEDKIYRLLEDMIKRDFADKKAKSLRERQAEEIGLIKNSYLSSYVRRYPEEFAVMKLIGDFDWETHITNGTKETDCAVLCGGAGTGKSALMAFIASEAEKNKTPSVLCFAAASGCRNPSALKNYIAYRLEELLGEEHNENPVSADELLRILDKKAEKRGYVCFVDGIDQIYGGERTPYIDLPALCPNIFWVFSTLPDFPYSSALCDYRTDVVQVEGLYLGQRKKMVADTAGKRGKKLDSETTDMITKSRGAANPLFISLVLQRLFMMNKAEFEKAESIAPSMEGLHRYMGEILSTLPDSPNGMAAYILDFTAKMFYRQQFSDVLLLIAMSKNGLTENEIGDMIALDGRQFSQIGFQQTVSYLYDAFTLLGNGKWIFAHRLFGEAVLSAADEADKERIGRLLIHYSESDNGFMEREGFYYLLNGKSDSVESVIINAANWETREEVFNEIGCLSREHAEYREFFVELAKKHPSDGMADFWLTFNDFIFGNEVEKMTGEIIKILLESDVGDKYKWQLALKSLYWTDKENALWVLGKASEYCAELKEPDISIAYAGIYAETARVLTALEKPYSEIEASRNKAVEYTDRAIEVIKDCGESKEYCSLFEYMKLVCRNASSWDSPDTLDLWLHSLELTESAHRYADTDDIEYYKAVFLLSICRTYCKKQFRDYEKAKLYGEKAIHLAEKAVSLRPTVRNLEIKILAFYAYVEWLKEEYQYPYLRKAVDCAKRLYSTQKSEYYKRELAYAEARYAASIGKAINTRNEEYGRSVIGESDEIWDHSFELFEELLALNNKDDLDSYASYLAARAEIYRERGYLEKATEFAKRSAELFEDMLKRHSEKAKTVKTEEALRYVLADISRCNGWLARVKGTVANICMSRLELSECEACADEAASLSAERAKDVSAHFKRVVECTALSAKAKYYQRKDEEALNACNALSSLLSDPRAEKYDINKYKCVEKYIRSRIALERGELGSAWENYLECAQYSEKYPFDRDRALILKADILTAKGDAQSRTAWLDALKEWRLWEESERGRLENDTEFKLYERKGSIVRRAYRRESRDYAIAAYYNVYCCYKITAGEAIDNEIFTEREKELFEIFELCGCESLNKLRPAYIKVGRIHEKTAEPYNVPKVEGFDGFLDAAAELTDKERHLALPALYDLILENADILENAHPTSEQFAQIYESATIMNDNLCKESVAFEHATKDTELIRNAFPLKAHIPVFRRQISGYRIWSEQETEKRLDRWRALLMLLVLATRCGEADNEARNKCLGKAMTAYKCLADIQNSEKKISDADISVITDSELRGLINAFSMERELRMLGGWITWYELKNIWIAEMYYRTGDNRYISERLAEFGEFLTDKYEEIFNEYRDIDSKKTLAQEIAHAAANFIGVLTRKRFNDRALDTAKWIESTPKLKGRMTSRTVAMLKAVSDGDRRWLEELKLRYCEGWTQAAAAGFWALKTM